jgi:hypothetical protein
MSLAAWHNLELVRVWLLPLDKAAKFGKRDLWQAGRDTHLLGVESVVIEKMVHYPGQHGARADAQANDLIDLTAASCLLAGSLKPREIRFVTPHEWKGSLPKEVCHARIQKKLTPAELGILAVASSKIRGSLVHNLWDAVGIGLFALGR